MQVIYDNGYADISSVCDSVLTYADMVKLKQWSCDKQKLDDFCKQLMNCKSSKARE